MIKINELQGLLDTITDPSGDQKMQVLLDIMTDPSANRMDLEEKTLNLGNLVIGVTRPRETNQKGQEQSLENQDDQEKSLENQETRLEENQADQEQRPPSLEENQADLACVEKLLGEMTNSQVLILAGQIQETIELYKYFLSKRIMY